VEAVIGWQDEPVGTAGTLACCEAKSGWWDRMSGWFCRVGDVRRSPDPTWRPPCGGRTADR